MENYIRSNLTTSNDGNVKDHLIHPDQVALKTRNFKLMADPSLIRGVIKLYRYDGIAPPDSGLTPIVVMDPRHGGTRIRSRPIEPMILTVPRFKIDKNYVGEPPSVEITITNLNDNIDKPFLTGMLDKCGIQDDINIYHHPVSNKHLGVARIVFETPKAARICIDKYNQTSVMGKLINVFYDPFGTLCKSTIENIMSAKPRQSIPNTQLVKHSSSDTVIQAPNPISHIVTSTSRNKVLQDRGYEERQILSHNRERYNGNDRNHADIRITRDRERSRDRYLSSYDKDRSKHRHYHRKRERSVDYKYNSMKNGSKRHDHNRDRDKERSIDNDRRSNISGKHKDLGSKEKNQICKERGDKYSSRQPKLHTRDNLGDNSTSSRYNSLNTSASSNIQSIPNYFSTNLDAKNSNFSPYNNYSNRHRTDRKDWTISHPKVSPPTIQPDSTPNWDDDSEVQPLSTSGLSENNEVNAVNVDLDTRIAMMFKGKSFGDAPPFLQMDSSESDTEKIFHKEIRIIDADKNKKLKSKLLSHKRFKRPKSQNSKIQQSTSDISSSDDEILLKKESYSPIISGHLKEDDRLSLSSISSQDGNGQHIEEKPPPEPFNVVVNSSLNLPNSEKNNSDIYSYPVTYSNFLYGQINSSQYFQNPAYMPSTYLPGFGAAGLNSSYVINEQYNNFNLSHCKSNENYKEIYHNRYEHYIKPIEEVVNRVSDELKQILKRDFNKKIIESTAYKKFEMWWDENLQKNRFKDKCDKNLDKTLPVTTSLTFPIQSSTKVDNQISSITRDISDYTSYSTIGLRASIPKLPSFRRIRKEKSPHNNKDIEKHLSDQEEMVHGSDSELDEGNSVSAISQFNYQQNEELNTTKGFSIITKHNRILSTSSVSSSSSENGELQSSENGSTVSYDDLSLISDEELKPNVSKHRNSDSCDSKPNVYSDSECEQVTKDVVPSICRNIRRASLSDLEDISKDSTLSIEENKITKTENTPIISKDLEDQQNVIDVGINKEKKLSEAEKKSVFDRIYSDSEEEREYQERRRRNTEYMAQIEQEFMEEQKRQKNEEQEEIKNNTTTSPIPEKLSTTVQNTSKTTASHTLSVASSIDTPSSNMEISSEKTVITTRINTVDSNSENKLKNGSNIKNTGSQDILQKDISDVDQFLSNGYNKIDTTNTNVSNILKLESMNSQTDGVEMSPNSSDDASSQASQVALEHCYSLPPEADNTSTKKNQSSKNNTYFNEKTTVQFKHHLSHDHGSYATCVSQHSTHNDNFSSKKQYSDFELSVIKPGPGRPRKDSIRLKRKWESSDRIQKSNQTNLSTTFNSHQFHNFIPAEIFSPRDPTTEQLLVYEFLTKGIDAEDIQYMRLGYQKHLHNDYVYGYLLNNTHWVDHCITDRSLMPPSNKKRKKEDELIRHKTGCARTEGYYKLDIREKAKHKYHHAKANADNSLSLDRVDEQALPTHNKIVSKMQGISREARSNQRRLLTAFASIGESELLKFNQLKFRKKLLKFAKSAIHDWGLFAMEPIAADEMVIEYVGQMIRPVVADLRETNYESRGIGSSYLFRIDMETIIDATKCGNLARFINHSCNPNCYAKVITIESEKKIVIYSKQPIGVNEEITYDYKFPLEEDKIACLCGAQGCRGTLN
ncbi:histone-lysine N-methyltransferase SETD1 isoform X2 [Teleopsis dalmanni]|uniref:histone-lysine N-methyltransferase SETD1 isoform X2 n=1 Tax=Teleopsis dalmanni TaxID=139649 RepID=UPI0018CD5466|nr:histone-lysine N-methyltransferase SETD1 isoform X2 [Teleopsis dalmanni]